MIDVGKYIRNIDEINQIFREHRLLKIFTILFYKDNNFYIDYINKINEIFKIDEVSEIMKNVSKTSPKEIIKSEDFNRINEALRILIPVICDDIEAYLEEYLYEYPELIEKFRKIRNDSISLINSIEVAKPRKAIYSTEWNKRALAVVLPHSFIVSLFLKYEVEVGILALVDLYFDSIDSTENLIEALFDYIANSIDNELLVDSLCDFHVYSIDLQSIIHSIVSYTAISLDSICSILNEVDYTLYLIDLYNNIYLNLDYYIGLVSRDVDIILILDGYIEAISLLNSITLALYESVFSITSDIEISLQNVYTIELISTILSISSSFTVSLLIISKQLPNIIADFLISVYSVQPIELSITSINSITTESITKLNEILVECSAVLAIGVDTTIDSLFDSNTNTYDTVSVLTSNNYSYIESIDSDDNLLEISISTYNDILESIAFIESNIDSYLISNDVIIFISTIDIDIFNYAYDIIIDISLNFSCELLSLDIIKYIETIIDIQTLSLSLYSSISYTITTSKDTLVNIVSIICNIDRTFLSTDTTSSLNLEKEISLSWYSIRYKYKANLTISNIYNRKLENVVVALIFKGELSNIMANGDIAFVNPSNYQRYKHYRERDNYRNTTIVFIKIPEINANSSITIEMYYGSIDDDMSDYETFDTVISTKNMTMHLDERLISTRVYKLP